MVEKKNPLVQKVGLISLIICNKFCSLDIFRKPRRLPKTRFLYLHGRKTLVQKVGLISLIICNKVCCLGSCRKPRRMSSRLDSNTSSSSRHKDKHFLSPKASSSWHNNFKLNSTHVKYMLCESIFPHRNKTNKDSLFSNRND